jgi:hypothetical protein
VVLAHVGEDGYPTGTVVRCRYADGVLHLDTALGPGTVVCAVAERAPDYHGIKGVTVHGRLGDGGVLPVGDDVVSFDFAKAR